ncbi:MAG: hypothetical protein GX587_08255 [Bacteroidales bacterium]|nr:hypothetical protein [Bacteroidales bacterium]
MVKKICLKDATRANTQIDAHIMFSDKRIEIVHLRLQAQEQIAAHKNNLDVLFYVKKGTATIQIEEKELSIDNDKVNMIANDTHTPIVTANMEFHPTLNIKLFPNEFLYVEKDLNRILINQGNETCEILVVKLNN